jgi:hypothetical protein
MYGLNQRASNSNVFFLTTQTSSVWHGVRGLNEFPKQVYFSFISVAIPLVVTEDVLGFVYDFVLGLGAGFGNKRFLMCFFFFIFFKWYQIVGFIVTFIMRGIFFSLDEINIYTNTYTRMSTQATQRRQCPFFFFFFNQKTHALPILLTSRWVCMLDSGRYPYVRF